MNESEAQQGKRPSAFNNAVRRLERCPKCGVENEFGQSPTIDVNAVTRQAFCNSCSHSWKVIE
jgi:hypothetical protein